MSSTSFGRRTRCQPSPPKPFVLEVRFERKEDFQLVRRKLKKAAGASNDLGVGLLNVLGEIDHE